MEEEKYIFVSKCAPTSDLKHCACQNVSWRKIRHEKYGKYRSRRTPYRQPSQKMFQCRKYSLYVLTKCNQSQHGSQNQLTFQQGGRQLSMGLHNFSPQVASESNFHLGMTLEGPSCTDCVQCAINGITGLFFLHLKKLR